MAGRPLGNPEGGSTRYVCSRRLDVGRKGGEPRMQGSPLERTRHTQEEEETTKTRMIIKIRVPIGHTPRAARSFVGHLWQVARGAGHLVAQDVALCAGGICRSGDLAFGPGLLLEVCLGSTSPRSWGAPPHWYEHCSSPLRSAPPVVVCIGCLQTCLLS